MAGVKFVAATFALLAGISMICPLCATGPTPIAAQTTAQTSIPDTGTVRLHISGMTCGSCPITARIALRSLPGMVDAKVTLQDSLGVVQYLPRRVTPSAIAAELLRVTGFRASVLGKTDAPIRRKS